MELYKITIPKDDAWHVIEAFGQKGFAHLIDLNKQEQHFNLLYANVIRTCDETERRLKFLIAKCKEFGLAINKPQSQDVLEQEINLLAARRQRSVHLLLQDLEQDTAEKEKFVRQELKVMKDVKEEISKQVDYYQVLHFIASQAKTLENIIPASSRSFDIENLNGSNKKVGSISFVAGTIRNEDRERLIRLLFRVTKGKAFTCFGEPFLHGDHLKLVYMVVYQEDQLISDRVQKVCDSFRSSRFQIHSLGDKLFAEHQRVRAQIIEDRALLKFSTEKLKEYLKAISCMSEDDPKKPSQLELIQFHVAKEKAIYTAMNMMKLRDQNYHGFFWAPVSLEPMIRKELEQFKATELQSWRSNLNEPHIIQPPTSFNTNDVIWPSQMITNTYGVPSYGEANPAVFSIVTFPYLFAIMFGDYGHGSIILFVGLVMVLFKKRLAKMMPGMEDALKLRYMLLLMGLFSCYVGVLYNEWFGIPYPWLSSCYETEKLPTNATGYVFQFVDFHGPNTTAFDDAYCVYPFGMDPTWFLSHHNHLTVQNSMKMKISVIVGVLHMTMGIVVKGLNNWNNRIVFYFEVIAGLFILLGLFGWMDVLIITKWLYPMNPYSVDPTMVARINAAPSIISIMINNFLLMGRQPFTNSTHSEVDIYMFESHREMSLTFVGLVIFVIPFMLCVKPCSLLLCPKLSGLAHHDKVTPENHLETNNQSNNIDPTDHGITYHTEANLLTLNDVKEIEEIELPHANKVQENESNQLIDEYKKIIQGDEDSHAAHSISEVSIHQLIETIEFVLGAVSNTASYLRLWALSLAHSQLALVFLENILAVPWHNLNHHSMAEMTIGSFFIWFPFMAVTFSVLLMMDVLECFLHTLRLHWVEFQNKFFKGAGYQFVPFSFEAVFIKELRR